MELLRLRKIISSTWYFWRLEHGLALVRSLHKPTLWPLPRWEISCCLCLEVLYKLPSDYIFCASYIAGSHQTNLGVTAFSNMTPEKKTNVSLRPNLCEMVETRPWILWRPNCHWLTVWSQESCKFALLLSFLHLGKLILYSRYIHEAQLLADSSHVHTKSILKQKFSVLTVTFSMFSISGELPFKTKIKQDF